MKPMLAHDYWKQKKKVEFPCFVQPKLDGIRCIASMDENFNVKLTTRSELVITTVPHIEEDLKGLLLPGDVCDGELYVHLGDFDKLNGDVRADVNKHDTSYIQYHIYDFIPFNGNTSEPYAGRIMERNNRDCMGTRSLYSPTKFVVTDIARDHNEIEFWLDEYINEGYEGCMVRNCQSPYAVDKRSFDLLKVKKFLEEEFVIVDYKEGKGKLKGHVGAFVCQLNETDEDKTFDVKLGGNQDELKRLFNNPGEFIGKLMTVKFFERTKNGVPRFPVGKCIRFDI